MTQRILWKMDARCTLGWIDHSPLSYDWRVASARAYRIQQRCKGVRLTLRQAMR
jgi:hypothetical protein